MSRLDEQAMPLSTTRKRQCQTLLMFIGLDVLQATSFASQSASSEVQDILSSLLELAIIDDASNQDVRDISDNAQWSLLQFMKIISVSFFSSTVLSMLSSDSVKVTVNLAFVILVHP